MNLHPTCHRTMIAGLLALAAIATASGCGGSNNDKIKDLQQQGTQLQESATDAKTQLEAIQRKVASGELSAEDAQAEIQKITDRLDASARTTADKALDTASGMDGVPDDAKEQIEQARTQLQQQP